MRLGPLLEKLPPENEKKGESLSEAELALYNTLVPENRKKAIQLADFKDIYKDAAEDEARTIELEKKFSLQDADRKLQIQAKRSKLFEAIINNQIEDSNWFGPDATVIVASKHDDYINGVDSIVEFEEDRGKSHLALAIDITKSNESLITKFADIRDSIQSGRLSRVKYFRSEGYRGELSSIPRVVVGADYDTMQQVVELLVRFRNAKNKIKKPKGTPEHEEAIKELDVATRQLSHHQLLFRLLFEIKIQLEAFRQYAMRIGRPGHVAIYEKTLRIINQIIEDKMGDKNRKSVIEEARKDSVFRAIVRQAEGFDRRITF